jgi:nucleoid DNA-binding protein
MINQDKIIEQLAIKYKLPKFVVEDIVRSQFRFLQSTMEQGEHKGMRLHRLGVFMVKPERVVHLTAKFERARLRKEAELEKSNNQ